MRAFMIAVGLVVTVLVAGLIWFSSQLTSQSVLKIVTTQLSDVGFEASSHGKSSLGIFPDAFIHLERVSIVIPETDEAPEQTLALEGLRFDLSLVSLLRTPKGYLSIKRASFEAIDIVQITTDILFDTTVSLPNVDARLWNGALQGGVVIDPSDTRTPISTQGSLQDADAVAVAAALAQFSFMQGSLSLEWQLDIFPPQSESGVAAVTGTIAAQGSEVKLSSVDLETSFCNAVNTAQGRPTSYSETDQTSFQRFKMHQTLSGTEVMVDELTFATDALSVVAQGSLDRATTKFSATAVANLNARALNERPNCKINPRLAEVQWPIQCQGMTESGSPRSWCAVDGSTILQQGFRSRLNDKLNLDDPTNLMQSLLKRIR